MFSLIYVKNVFITYSPFTGTMHIIAAVAIRKAELAKTTILVRREINNDGNRQ